MPEDSRHLKTGSPETSESEEMYLLTVAVAEEDGHAGPLALAALASSLGVSSASVNEMVRKLARRELVTYEPYRGVELTELGRRVAQRVLRTRRLWSTFLAGELEFSPHRADALACHLEHVTPPDAAERLARYLGDPEAGPLGRRIPRGVPTSEASSDEPLSALAAGNEAEVVVVVADDVTSAFLLREGIAPGVAVRVLGTGSSGVLVDVGGGRVHLARDVAAAVLVRSEEGAREPT